MDLTHAGFVYADCGTVLENDDRRIKTVADRFDGRPRHHDDIRFYTVRNLRRDDLASGVACSDGYVGMALFVVLWRHR